MGKFSKLWIWLLVIVLIIIGFVAAIAEIHKSSDKLSASAISMADWQTFVSNPKGYDTLLANVSSSFAFKYPPGWTISYNSNPRAILTLLDPAISAALAECQSKQSTPCAGDTGIDLFGVAYATSSDAFFAQNYPDYQNINVADGLDVFKYEPSGNPVTTYHINFPDKTEAVEFSPENIIDSDYAQELSQIVQSFQVAQ